MPISFAAVQSRGRRRIRLFFDNSLAAAAFTSLSFYTVTCDDGAGPSPNVLAAMLVANSPNVVELVLGYDLVDGGLYTVTANGVPASDGSTTATPSTAPFRLGEVRARPAERTEPNDALLALLGVDLAFDGDFLEDASGDLASVSGVRAVLQQGQSAVESNGLPWDLSYGAKLRKYVDGSKMLLGRAADDAAQAMLKDDRFTAVTAEVKNDEIEVHASLIGDDTIDFSARLAGTT